MFLRATVTSITAAWQINKHYWRVSASLEGRAGLQGVCQGDVVICPVLTELSFLLLVSVNRNSYWGGLKNSRLYMWKARCYKTLLAKHFLFGALAWHTVDVRHKAFLFPLHLTPSVFQRGAPWRPGLEPWQMWWGCWSPSCSRESPLLCAKFLSLSGFVSTDVEEFLWVLFGWFLLLLLFGIFLRWFL